jgi:hypothetical protein
MQTLQMIICRCAVDRDFLADVLSSPHDALREYDLSTAEFALLADPSVRSLVDLASAVESWRRGEPRTARVRELALAG